jgi:H/ACA ribonucleoprotein complex subunit 3
MKQVLLNGKPLTSLKEIGAGQEAVVYDIGGGMVAKLYRQPNDPYYAGSQAEQQAANIRLARIQKKLSAFPKGLPANVIGPRGLLTNTQGATIGYVMPFIRGAETLLTYGDLQFRESKNISNNEIRDIFLALHQTLKELHTHGVVIGDFNDLNILVKAHQPYMIDTDSWQFANFLSTMYTEKFVDPLLCGLNTGIWTMTKAHNPLGDWYAFNALLFKTLLFVDPYGGIYKPKESSKRLKQQLRPQNRITVFHPEVIYPKHALDYKVLPEKLLQHFKRVFIDDQRGEFPLQLLSSMHWQTCPKCGIQHARTHCPICTAGVVIPITVSGNVQVHEIFRTTGVILCVAFQNGKLQYLYHENDTYKRENAETVGTGSLDRDTRFALQGSATVFAKASTLQYTKNATTSKLSIDCIGNVPIFSTTENDLFWVVNGNIQHANPLGLDYTPVKVGEGIADQTLIWAGPTFGFGMYKAGHILQGFTFEKGRSVINDTVQLPFIKGEIIDAKCYLSETRAWLLISTKDKAKYLTRAIVLDTHGKVLADLSNENADYPWLEQIKGKSAMGGFLFCPTDEGIVRLGIDASGTLETKVFSDTAPYVNQYSQLIVSPKGIYVLRTRDIVLLTIK